MFRYHVSTQNDETVWRAMQWSDPAEEEGGAGSPVGYWETAALILRVGEKRVLQNCLDQTLPAVRYMLMQQQQQQQQQQEQEKEDAIPR